MTIAAAVMVALLPGMRPIGEPKLLAIAVFALFLALVNAWLKPAMHVVSQVLALPFSIATFGVFAILTALVVNWLCMELASWLAIGLFGFGVYIPGFWDSVIGSIIMTVVGAIVGGLIER
ncbi:putative membrane protein [Bifidobacterium bohemicum]|nr:putative membrane protein [Bifidobacterium bohemicum]